MKLISIHYTLGRPGSERKANGIYSIQDHEDEKEKALEYIRGIQNVSSFGQATLVSVSRIQNGYV